MIFFYFIFYFYYYPHKSQKNKTPESLVLSRVFPFLHKLSISLDKNYSIISVTEPAPTVLPPSRYPNNVFYDIFYISYCQKQQKIAVLA